MKYLEKLIEWVLNKINTPKKEIKSSFSKEELNTTLDEYFGIHAESKYSVKPPDLYPKAEFDDVTTAKKVLESKMLASDDRNIVSGNIPNYSAFNNFPKTDYIGVLKYIEEMIKLNFKQIPLTLNDIQIIKNKISDLQKQIMDLQISNANMQNLILKI